MTIDLDLLPTITDLGVFACRWQSARVRSGPRRASSLPPLLHDQAQSLHLVTRRLVLHRLGDRAGRGGCGGGGQGSSGQQITCALHRLLEQRLKIQRLEE